MSLQATVETLTSEKTTPIDVDTRKVTIKIPIEVYLKLVKLVLYKHKSIYGHFNRECTIALENHLNNEFGSHEGLEKIF